MHGPAVLQAIPSTTLLAEHLQPNAVPQYDRWQYRSGPIAMPIGDTRLPRRSRYLQSSTPDLSLGYRFGYTDLGSVRTSSIRRPHDAHAMKILGTRGEPDCARSRTLRFAKTHDFGDIAIPFSRRTATRGGSLLSRCCPVEAWSGVEFDRAGGTESRTPSCAGRAEHGTASTDVREDRRRRSGAPFQP